MSRRPTIQPKVPTSRSRPPTTTTTSTSNPHHPTNVQSNDEAGSGYMSQSETCAFISEFEQSDATKGQISILSSRSTVQLKQPPSRRQPAHIQQTPQTSNNQTAVDVNVHHAMNNSSPFDPNFSDEINSQSQSNVQSPYDKFVSASDNEDIFRGFDHDDAISALSSSLNAPTRMQSAFHSNAGLPLILTADDNELFGNNAGILTAQEQLAITEHLLLNNEDLESHPSEVLQHQIKSKHVVQIQNMVGVVDLKTEIDLKKIAASLRNSEYNPRRFLSVVIRLREPKVTGLIFQSGKLVLTGAKTEHQTHLGARKIARLIQKVGHPDVTFNNFQITNMVGYTDVRFPIDLQHLINKHPQYCEFDPELFPALVYRLQQPPCSISIFVNGKVLLTGARTRAEIYQAFELVYPVLCEFKKGSYIQDPLGAPASAFEDSAAVDEDNAAASAANSVSMLTDRSLLGGLMDDFDAGFDEYE